MDAQTKRWWAGFAIAVALCAGPVLIVLWVKDSFAGFGAYDCGTACMARIAEADARIPLYRIPAFVALVVFVAGVVVRRVIPAPPAPPPAHSVPEARIVGPGGGA
jgi:hypothetical protein